MKKFLSLIAIVLLVNYTCFSQVQATIKPGSQPNSVYITFKPATTLNGAKFSTFQFAVGIPAALSTGVTATVTSLDPLISYSPETSTETQGGVSYTVFGFSGDGGQSGAGSTFTAGVEYNYAEVFFSGPAVLADDVRLMQLPDGGNSTNVNFYVADKGTPVSSTTVLFYSSVAANVSNDGLGNSGSSFVKIGSIILPVKFLGFNVSKKDGNALLTWQIENESAVTDRYEIERSLNGLDFKKINVLLPKKNGSSTNTYEYTELNLAAVKPEGPIYYRIKQIDKDGQFALSTIKNVRLDTRNLEVGVFPNPVKSNATLFLDLVKDARVTITINDASGKQVQNVPMQLFKGVNKKDINMSSLAAGSYLLKISTGDEVKTVHVVKTN
ncbi:MAG: T9SS type A sorting domain-containing protein [Ferruginibacter sp.]|nr:T9SS type A sorting domain-containing protein [Ferruginibacter sp.]